MAAECCPCNIFDKIDWGKNKGVKRKVIGLICLLIIFILVITIIICCTYTYYGGKTNSSINVMLTISLGKCQLILDARSGKFPPLLLQNGQFKFPVSKNDKDESILSFGKFYTWDLNWRYEINVIGIIPCSMCIWCIGF